MKLEFIRDGAEVGIIASSNPDRWFIDIRCARTPDGQRHLAEITAWFRERGEQPILVLGHATANDEVRLVTTRDPNLAFEARTRWE